MPSGAPAPAAAAPITAIVAEELAAMRAKQKAEGRSMRYDGTCATAIPARRRRTSAGHPPQGAAERETVIRDHVQARSPSPTPARRSHHPARRRLATYNLSVVVDDHDMAISHVIRGDDHLNNAFRQTQIYRAMDWAVPSSRMSADSRRGRAKLSKRHGALAVDAYRDMGYLPEALRNYLLRLGWSHATTRSSAATRRSPGSTSTPSAAARRVSIRQAHSLNGHYIRQTDDPARRASVPFLERLLATRSRRALARLCAAWRG